MAEQLVPVEARPLSQAERVVDTFVAPSKTFTDILRSTSWWLPWLLIALCAALSAYSVDKKIGFEPLAEQTIQQNSRMQDQMSQMPPAARARQVGIIAASTRISAYAAGVIVLVIIAFTALLNWATINFAFGGRTTFGQNMAVQMYAGLPLMLRYALSAILVFTGANTENFDMRNPVGTNPGFYMQDAAPWLKTLLTFFDFFGLWSLVLAVIGLSIISRKGKGAATAVVVGWWLITVMVITGITAATS